MKFIFVHIPKCGGTTVIKTMSTLLANPLHIYPASKLDTIADDVLFNSNFIACHATLPHFKKRFGKKIENYKLITSLRNPVDRYLSEWHTWQRGGHKETWDQYLNFPLNNNAITNFLTGTKNDVFCPRKTEAVFLQFHKIFTMDDLSVQLFYFLEETGFVDYKIQTANRNGVDQTLDKPTLHKMIQNNLKDLKVWDYFTHNFRGH